MNIVFWGTPQFSVGILKALLDSKHNIIAVVTQPDKKRRRGQQQCPSPIKEIALQRNIRIFTPIKVKDDLEMKKELKSLKADIYIVVAFGQILPLEILSLPRLGCWNIHTSLLPKWRGAAPIQWSLIKGEKETGVAIMLMEEGLDTGPILIEKKVPITKFDNALFLSDKLCKISSELIIKALKIIVTNHIDNIEDINLIQQSSTGREISIARKISKEDYLIEWNKPAIVIHNKIRGLYPNAYSYIGNKRVKILSSIPISSDSAQYKDAKLQEYKDEGKYIDIKPGYAVGILKGSGIIIKASEGLLLITGIKIEGKNEASENSLIQQIAFNRKINTINFSNYTN
ncbi:MULTISPECIES: methionyl-tRNA formyltransferase [unclassified Prochlorococcus]|uniref:methionyl-tRNA formyltransferase n=1 Tax=unclassified Prochlorococcus TaxID=2627481 RepID=UPI000533A440|nr:MULTISPECIES: methionyl-tRNA formyltransferase [unclassified Prochlorococcus]KGG15316.1 Methionyl-tRNA formyltransferase [Prochlorococcus sp. MIT 0602]KGG17595.1 Methionyl-tRNA formyltransferase [Prochlorococcus sp. MIT 0603]